MKRALAPSGFTLLEVLVAIAILGLGMTSILSAQAGLFASSLYAERVSIATGVVRCKLSELEVKLAKEGYPLLDQKEEGPCCGDDATPGYKCKWKIEKVELPPPPQNSDISGKMGSLGSSMGSSSSGALGSIGAIAAIGQSNGAVVGSSPGLSDISKLFAGESPLGSGPGGVPGGLNPGTPPATSPSDSFGSTPFGATPFGNSVPGTTPLGAVQPAGGGQMPGAMGG
ncbi:MAG: type IV pilus modification PilV family protein, partial [Thermoanaerobaculia bacterium]